MLVFRMLLVMKFWNLTASLAAIVFSGVIATTSLSAQEAEEPFEYEGLVIDLKDGSKANVLIEDKRFTVRFYNQEDEVIDLVYKKAIIDYESVLKKSDKDRIVLRPSGDALSATKPVFPPYKFTFTIILKDDADESHREVFARQRLEM